MMSRHRWLIVGGAGCGAIVAAAIALGVSVARDRKRELLGLDPSRFAETAQQLEQLRQEIIARDGGIITRPVFRPGVSVPSDREVLDYCGVRLGLLRPADDEDARLMLAMRREHSSPDVRVIILHSLPVLLSDGYPFELARSEVSQDLRAEVIAELVSAIVHPIRSTPHNERDAAVTASLIYKLWRHEAIWDALTAVRHETDVREVAQNKALYEIMDLVPRGSFEPPP